MATKIKNDLVILSVVFFDLVLRDKCAKQRDALFMFDSLQSLLPSLRSAASLRIAVITAFSEVLSLV